MKTKFKDIMFIKNFKAMQETFDIGSKADAIANLAKERIAEDGELAKIHASVILVWMEEMVDGAVKSYHSYINDATPESYRAVEFIRELVKRLMARGEYKTVFYLASMMFVTALEEQPSNDNFFMLDERFVGKEIN